MTEVSCYGRNDCDRVTWGPRDHDSWLDNKDGFGVTSRWVVGAVWTVWSKGRHSCLEILSCCSKWLAIYGSWIVYFWNVPFLFLDCGWLWAIETTKSETVDQEWPVALPPDGRGGWLKCQGQSALSWGLEEVPIPAFVGHPPVSLGSVTHLPSKWISH